MVGTVHIIYNLQVISLFFNLIFLDIVIVLFPMVFSLGVHN